MLLHTGIPFCLIELSAAVFRPDVSVAAPIFLSLLNGKGLHPTTRLHLKTAVLAPGV